MIVGPWYCIDRRLRHLALPLLLLLCSTRVASAQVPDTSAQVVNSLGRELLAAAEAGQVERIRDLLGKGADIESRDQHGRTPLMVATIEGQVRAVEFLLDAGSDLFVWNFHGADAFEFAVINDRDECVGLFLERGIDLKSRGGSALRASARAGGTRTAMTLMEHGVDVDARDSSYATPLMHAVSARQRAMVALLIENGADVHAVDRKGATPLSLALVGPWGRDTKIAKMLRKAGAKK